MKHLNIILVGLATLLLGGLVTACSDFDDLNKSPFEAGANQVQVEYFINNAIISAQMNPHVAERAFVLYWKDAGHMDRIGSLSQNRTNDEWTQAYFDEVTSWLTHINSAISLYQEQKAEGNTKTYSNNLYQVARIWRVYLMSEFTDNFGVMPINSFQGEKVQFNTTEEVYTFMLKELKEAVAGFDTNTVSGDITNLDPAYGYDFDKWAKYGNSLRMRLAMRISGANPTLAKTEFEEAAKGGKYISTFDDNFAVQERPGWDALTGVMSREWNNQFLSPTLNNLYLGLGGITSEVQVGAYARAAVDKLNKDRETPITLKFCDPDYMGVKREGYFSTKTNDPSAGYWSDGLPYSIDPRAYKAFNIPGDINNPHFNRYPSWNTGVVTNTERPLLLPKQEGSEKQETLAKVNSAFAWNISTPGNWGEMDPINKVYSFPGSMPRLVNEFRNSSMKRVFFGSWESYFLLAEAAIKGWSVGIDAKEAYEAGIKESFTYWDKCFPDNMISKYLTEYLASEDYNRVGTSVSWDHTAEPPATKEVSYLDGKTKEMKKATFTYPANQLYKNGQVKNDHLTKIITQKFIAQVPWLPLETWSDHRRLGLPFFENPVVEKTIEGFDALTTTNYMESKWEFFPQRLPFPTSLKNNVPESYKDAVDKLGGPDNIYTKMWWSAKP
ncbi:SusD/RagB family nutrient-binding outer membrane lipoprotein [uncultured Porphyromonas sp.]|uniref:SusD/RagB family nutrient-binding outer membrane lipoprotein n=1 Tax=uncultured Porphyromonas sp. TaxID=159274 RepID=UPI0025962C92|nr:SusD/RagB family nutrient-binding outer membrane lipoprotein [uncultured Porphyromonas sp.]